MRPSTPPRGSTSVFNFAVVQNIFGATQIDPEELEREQRLADLEAAAKRNFTPKNRRLNWSKLLNHNFVIGENHTHVNPKKFLIENMQILKDSGYNTIFIEHLHPDLEASIEEYFARSGRDTPENLKSRLDFTTVGYMSGEKYQFLNYDQKYLDLYRDQVSKYNYNSLVRKASEVGIKVVPLEISEENYKSFAHGKDRMMYLNSNTVEVVKREQEKNPDLKYVALVGMSHLLRKDDVVGIAEALGVQDVAIVDEIRPSDIGLGSLEGGRTFSKTIYDCEIDVDGKDKYLGDSTMGFVTHISEGVNFFENILPFAESAKLNPALGGASDSTPYSSIVSLSRPMPPKKLKKSDTSLDQIK